MELVLSLEYWYYHIIQRHGIIDHNFTCENKIVLIVQYLWLKFYNSFTNIYKNYKNYAKKIKMGGAGAPPLHYSSASRYHHVI